MSKITKKLLFFSLITNIVYCYAGLDINKFISFPKIGENGTIQHTRHYSNDFTNNNTFISPEFIKDGRLYPTSMKMNFAFPESYAIYIRSIQSLHSKLKAARVTQRPRREILIHNNLTKNIPTIASKDDNINNNWRDLNVGTENVSQYYLSPLTFSVASSLNNKSTAMTSGNDKQNMQIAINTSAYKDGHHDMNSTHGEQTNNRNDIRFFDAYESQNRKIINSSGVVSNNISNWSEVEATFRRLYPISLWKENGWFQDEYLHLINVHWLQFPPPPKAAHYTLGGLYFCMAVVGCAGNLLVIFMFFKCRSLRTPANILVVNLAVSDFFMIAKTPIFIYNSIYLGPALGEIGCRVYGFVGGLTGTVSIGTLAAIAFDRYSVVVYPLEPLRSVTGLRAKLSVLFVWLYGGFFAGIPALDIGLGRYVPEGYLTSCGFDYLSDDENHKIFIFAFFCAAWLLPFSIISFCYAKILKVVILTRSMGKRTSGSISSRHCKEQEKKKTEIKLAGVVIGVIGLFFAAWTPYAIVSLLGITGHKNLIHPITSMIPALFCKVASCIDPFIYVVTHPKFRQECENLLLCKKERRRRSTMRQGWSVTNTTKVVQQDQEITSEDDVEIVEMCSVPYSPSGGMGGPEGPGGLGVPEGLGGRAAARKGLGLASINPAEGCVQTISSHALTMGISADKLPVSLDSLQLQPPSWFVKPQFAKRENSLKKVVKTIKKMKSQESFPT